MTGLNYIADGMTLNGYIAEIPRLHDSLTFKYRPMLAADRVVVDDKIKRSNAREAEDIGSEVIASRVTEWNLVDEHGKSLPVKAEHVARMQWMLKSRLYFIVIGEFASDAPPHDIDVTKSRDKAKDDLAAAIAGTRPEDYQAGNSETA